MNVLFFMLRQQTFCTALTVSLILISRVRCDAADVTTVIKYADIQNAGHGVLTADGEIKFRKGMRGKRTKWSVESGKDGYRILTTDRGKLLGIDVKKKQLALFDKAGPQTTWLFKSAGAELKTRDDDFEVIIYMKVGEEELRLSSDDEGTPILGGKADILHFYIDGP